MKLYTMNATKLTPSPDMACDLHLPHVECSLCNQTWGMGLFQYPAFKFSFFTEKIFSSKNVVSIPEFQKIVARIQEAAGRPVIMVPGASVGELSGTTVTSKLQDFTWGTVIYPQISITARDRLEETGISLITATCTMMCRGKKLDTHLAIQAEPVPLLREEVLADYQITHCRNCGDYRSTYPRPKNLPPYEIEQTTWPQGKHMVTMVETLDLLATEEFREAVLSNNLQGLDFIECGRLV